MSKITINKKVVNSKRTNENKKYLFNPQVNIINQFDSPKKN